MKRLRQHLQHCCNQRLVETSQLPDLDAVRTHLSTAGPEAGSVGPASKAGVKLATSVIGLYQRLYSAGRSLCSYPPGANCSQVAKLSFRSYGFITGLADVCLVLLPLQQNDKCGCRCRC